MSEYEELKAAVANFIKTIESQHSVVTGSNRAIMSAIIFSENFQTIKKLSK